MFTIARILACAVLMCGISGCANQPVRAAESAPYQAPRFLPIQGMFWVALDTRSGQLCKTFFWEDDANPRYTKGLPSCVSLSNIDNLVNKYGGQSR